MENTGCDGNRIFQLSISTVFTLQCETVTAPKIPTVFLTILLTERHSATEKQESLLFTLHISQAADYTGGFHHRSKNMKSQRWNWQKTEQREEIVIWCFHLLYFISAQRNRGRLFIETIFSEEQISR